MGVCLRFPLSRALHLREFSNGYYQLLPFYAASVTSSLLLSAAYQVPQALLVFFMVRHPLPYLSLLFLWH